MMYILKKYSLLALLLLTSIGGRAAVDNTFKYDGLAYRITSEEDKTVSLTRFYVTRSGQMTSYNMIDYPETVVIPSIAIDGKKSYTVTGIETSAFYSNSAKVKNLTIPGTINKLVSGNLENLKNLKTLTILAGEEELDINDYVFDSSGAHKTRNIESFFLDRNITYHNNSNGVFVSGEFSEITFGEHFTKINPYMFENCKSLTSITIPATVSEFGTYAFKDCSSLSEVVLEGNYKGLPPGFFYGCTSLKEAYLPEGVENIEIGTFDGCTSISSLTIPASVKDISAGAFSGCTNIKTLSIPASDTELKISAYAFNNGNSGSIPGTLNIESIFLNRDIIYDTNNSGVFARGAFSEITFGEHFTRINPYMFENCKNLTSLVLPLNITEINKKAFSGCDNLNEISTAWTEPFAINNDVFSESSYNNANLLVPNNTTEIYANTEGWKNFVNIKIDTYIVTAQTTAGGKLTVQDKIVTSESPITLTIKSGTDFDIVVTPDEGYILNSLTVNNVERKTDIDNDKLSLTILDNDVDIKAIFVSENAISGDANDDGEVDAKDIVDIVNHTMGKPTSTGKFIETAADINGDGKVDIADIVALTKIIGLE